METKDAVDALAALAQETRLSVYRLLVEVRVHDLDEPPVVDAPGTVARADGRSSGTGVTRNNASKAIENSPVARKYAADGVQA